MSPFVSIGEAVIPKILGRRKGSALRYDSRIILEKFRFDKLHRTRIQTARKGGSSLYDELRRK